jgi:hypothetical protein
LWGWIVRGRFERGCYRGGDDRQKGKCFGWGINFCSAHSCKGLSIVSKYQ